MLSKQASSKCAGTVLMRGGLGPVATTTRLNGGARATLAPSSSSSLAMRSLSSFPSSLHNNRTPKTSLYGGSMGGRTITAAAAQPFPSADMFFQNRSIVNWGINFVPEKEAWVVQRLGKFHKVLQPGFNLLIPFVDEIAYVHSLKVVAVEIPNQQGITKDNVSITIGGVLYYKVEDPMKASYNVEDPDFAIRQLAMSTMRVEVGKLELDKTFEEREMMNVNIVKAINASVRDWGLDCLRYEIRDIQPPVRAMEAMELQMVAERKKRQMVIASEATREAEVNEAEGYNRAKILRAQAIKREKQLLAEGEADAIRVKAEATADGIEKLAASLRKPGALDAMKLRVAEQYVSAFGELAQKGTTVLLPSNPGDAGSMVAQAISIFDAVSKKHHQQQSSPSSSPSSSTVVKDAEAATTNQGAQQQATSPTAATSSTTAEEADVEHISDELVQELSRVMGERTRNEQRVGMHQ
ncbi:Synaptotagmin-like protein 2 [Balamuthia mandrillaris]